MSFDGSRLIDLITFYSLSEEFADVIVGFTDTLQVIKTETNRKGKGECSITGLANWFKISSANAHNAVQALTKKNHWPGIVIRVVTVIPREITTHDGSHACSYCNTNTTVGNFL